MLYNMLELILTTFKEKILMSHEVRELTYEQPTRIQGSFTSSSIIVADLKSRMTIDCNKICDALNAKYKYAYIDKFVSKMLL